LYAFKYIFLKGPAGFIRVSKEYVLQKGSRTPAIKTCCGGGVVSSILAFTLKLATVWR